MLKLCGCGEGGFGWPFGDVVCALSWRELSEIGEGACGVWLRRLDCGDLEADFAGLGFGELRCDALPPGLSAKQAELK